MAPSLVLSADSTAKVEAEEEELADVIITGTKIQTGTRANFDAQMTTITAQDMADRGITNIGDALLEMVPQNLSTYQPGLIGDEQESGAGLDQFDRQSFFIGNTIANLRGLDPAFGTRTLTLIDGRRVGSTSSQADVVDLNSINSSMVSRMDVVTGGNSAVYGSGAIGGVVNVVLNNRQTGFNINLDYGLYERGDGGSPRISMSGGIPLFEGKANLTLGADWQHQDPIRSCAESRAWCAQSRVLFNNYTGTVTNSAARLTTQIPGFENQPARFEMVNQRYSQWAPTGTIMHTSATTNTTGYRFSTDGTKIEEYGYGYRGGAGSSTVGGDAASASQPFGSPVTTSATPMRASSTTKSLNGSFEFNFTERTTAYVRASFSKTEGLNRNNYTSGNYCARWDTTGSAGTNRDAGYIAYFSQATVNAIGANGFATYENGTVVANYPPTGKTRDALLNPITTNVATFFDFNLLNGSNNTAATSTTGINQGMGPLNGGIGTSYITGNSVGRDNTAFYGANPTVGLRFIRTNAAYGAATTATELGPDGKPVINILPPGGTLPASVITESKGVAYPFWVPTDVQPTRPNFNFGGKGTGTWVLVVIDPSLYTGISSAGLFTNAVFYNPFWSNSYWLLESITLTSAYDLGTPTTYPGINPSGRSNAYAFLNTLSPQALDVMKTLSNVNTSATAGGGAGADLLYGQSPCANQTAIRKVWTPQVQRYSGNENESLRTTIGVRGRIGRDWRWDASLAVNSSKSTSSATNVATNLRLAFAMDAVIDDRLTRIVNGVTVSNLPAAGGTYGQPVCRVVRDGTPRLDSFGRELSDPQDLAKLGENCQPLNMFGNEYAQTSSVFPGGYNPAQTQQDAIDYAFVETTAGSTSSQKSLVLNTNGTLWSGWGAGAVTGAFGVDIREDKNDTPGSVGDQRYARADLANSWRNPSGGKTRITEPNIEFNIPLVSGVPGINNWSTNLAARYSSQYNKGGAGTTGQSSTQNLFTWRVQMVFSPFDFLTFNVSRTRDMRAPSLSNLFVLQPSIPDSQQNLNPWRDRTITSTENQQDRYGQVQVGNPDLKPELSRTLSFGVSVTPGGWAQGMRFTAGYQDTKVTRTFGTSFSAANPIRSCYEESGNEDPVYNPDDGSLLNPAYLHDAVSMDLESCQQLTFAAPGEDGRPYQDIVTIDSSRPRNTNLPTTRRNLDLSLNYSFPLSRAFEELPGTVSLQARASRVLESDSVQVTTNARGYYSAVVTFVATPATATSPAIPASTPIFRELANPDACGARFDRSDEDNNTPAKVRLTSGTYELTGFPGVNTTIANLSNPFDFSLGSNPPATRSINMDAANTMNGFYSNRHTCLKQAGQIRSSTFVNGGAASPKWTGTMSATYSVNDLRTTLSANYTGGGFIDRSYGDSLDDANFKDAQGFYLNGSIDNNRIKPYVRFSWNVSYDLKIANMRQFQVTGTVNNVLDKQPPFAGGAGTSVGPGVDIYGRAYRLGVRMRF